jgi:hypothetical protein
MVRLSRLPYVWAWAPVLNPFADNLSALQALISALNDLDTLCETIEDAYDTSLENDNIERWDEKS